MIFCVDKPVGLTSSQAVQLIKRAGGFKKVGHAGTLDPEASGVLVIGTDESTKLLTQLLAEDKEYVVAIRFGVHTDTYDASGLVVSYTGEVPSAEQVGKAFNSFPAHYQQIPPAYSAIKVNGQRAHAMMRQGKEVILAPRDAFLTDRQLLSYENGILKARLVVKKGFYVRSFAVDLAKVMNTLGTVVELRRTRSGIHTLSIAKKMAEFGYVPVKSASPDQVALAQFKDLVAAGQVGLAKELLDKPYSLGGIVVRGIGKARLLGYPTANIEHDAKDCWAADGVYKSETLYDGFRFRSITFVGISRDDKSAMHKFESHLFGFTGDLYGQTITSSLLRFIRANAHFTGKDELVAQIERDIKEAASPTI